MRLRCRLLRVELLIFALRVPVWAKTDPKSDKRRARVDVRSCVQHCPLRFCFVSCASEVENVFLPKQQNLMHDANFQRLQDMVKLKTLRHRTLPSAVAVGNGSVTLIRIVTSRHVRGRRRYGSDERSGVCMK